MSALLAGRSVEAGAGRATALPDMDFETYSEAGYVFDPDAKGGLGKWVSIVKSPPHGLGAVGAPAYSEHPSTEVLSLAYDLKDGSGPRLWVPGMPPPSELFDHISSGGLIEAWNSAFEYHIWTNVCVAKMGWPELPFQQLRDAMAKSRAWSLPGKLEKAAEVSGAKIQKLSEGKRLINKFCKPRQPTKKDPRTRLRLTDADQLDDAAAMYRYNVGDIAAESAVSLLTPDLSIAERDLWLLDQEINFRGMSIDTETLYAMGAMVKQVLDEASTELSDITDGAVTSPSQIQKMMPWLSGVGVEMASLNEEHVTALIAKISAIEDPSLGQQSALRVLIIRALAGSASVKKVSAIERRLSRDGRIRDLFAFCGADRTGRFAGRGPQPQNLPNSGPEWSRCGNTGKIFATSVGACPHCSECTPTEPEEWGPDGVGAAVELIRSGNTPELKRVFGEVIPAVAGCLRGLFSASAGHDLICSDYSAIEAVVLAALAGEEWRMEVFRTHGKIYEMSASKISGVPFEEFVRHKKETGGHHPLRKKIGKVAELASGYQGGYGAWLAFGADKHLEEQEIRDAIKAWRAESPNIVAFWHGLEKAARSAVQNPGQCYKYRDLVYGVKDDVLYCQLPSGRKLSYHQPRLHPELTPWGTTVQKLTYMGWNSDYKKGPKGWMRLDTYGGKLCENVVQAVARDILTHAMQNLNAAGYPIVLHVHDEVVSEVPEGAGSVEEFERIMATLPAWCADWPIKAAGGWRGKRYRK